MSQQRAKGMLQIPLSFDQIAQCALNFGVIDKKFLPSSGRCNEIRKRFKFFNLLQPLLIFRNIAIDN
ncbi:hypothetical protein IC63_02810 [Paracoccus sphaerophysae]|uniref:Uncharacterized protein n=1 Tax=Paracoccus sphaerophysae TaxID=690417 RepID=A0A099FEH0_9RHOB|nr:hypothetical protein IC63_02810 [Paracoccus sphaerophysae]